MSAKTNTSFHCYSNPDFTWVSVKQIGVLHDRIFAIQGKFNESQLKNIEAFFPALSPDMMKAFYDTFWKSGLNFFPAPFLTIIDTFSRKNRLNAFAICLVQTTSNTAPQSPLKKFLSNRLQDKQLISLIGKFV